jgi:4-amino-4-deoxy-L-arabinose transferase-like glycosyltransferase
VEPLEKPLQAHIELPRWAICAALIVILGFSAFVRLRLIDMPLERDEGEYAYAGQLMLQGIPPYELAYNMKLPGTYSAYAIIMAVFGETIRGIHTGLILINLATIFAVFLLGRRLFGDLAGIVAAFIFTLFSLSESVLGLAAHATHFVTLFAVCGALLLLRAFEDERLGSLFGSALLFGLAFVMKQQAIFFGVFGGLILGWHEIQRPTLQWRRIAARSLAFAGGWLLPFVFTCVTLAIAGVFARFWFWTFSYGRQYVSVVPLKEGWLNLRSAAHALLRTAPGVWIFVALGAVFLLSRGRSRQKSLFVLGFLLAAFASTCPGLYFRPHYLIPVLPAVGILTAAGMQGLLKRASDQKFRRTFLIGSLILFGVATADGVYRNRGLFFRLSSDQVTIAVYGDNIFPESLEIARYIRENSAPNARVAVLGSEPQIYFYSHRHSATGYIYTYGLAEKQSYAMLMQREMISEIERAKPEFIVLVNTMGSWMAPPNGNYLIFDWLERYGQEHYRSVGLVDIQSDETIYRWDEKAIAAIPHSKAFVRVFKRNDLF